MESSKRIEDKKRIQEESTLLDNQSINKQEEKVVSNKKPKQLSKSKIKSDTESLQPITPIENAPVIPIELELKDKESWVKLAFKRLLGKEKVTINNGSLYSVVSLNISL